MSDWGRARSNRGRGNYDDRDDDRQQQRFPNNGGLFPVNDKRSDNSPDMSGTILIADDVLDYIVREAQNGNEVLMELKGWRRISRNNTNYESIAINIPYNVRMEEGGNPTYRSQRGGGRRYSQPQRRRDDDRGDPQGNRYSQQSCRGRYDERNPPPRRNDDDEFSRGDRMPDFLRDDDDDAPPF
jgi:hypothetical protein